MKRMAAIGARPVRPRFRRKPALRGIVMARLQNARSTLRATLAALVGIALLQCAAPAHAQHSKGARKEDPSTAAAAQEKKQKARQIDEAYKASLKAIPDKPPSDPWGGMRSK